jgi:hypothetical protein
MPFRLTNSPATFQPYIDDCLSSDIDDFAACYLDNKLIYLTNEKEHEEHVHQVLQRLKEIGLYCKADTCLFGVWEVGFLRIIMTPDGVGMESSRISTIKDWARWKSVRDLQVLVGSRNLSRKFIRKCGKVTLPPKNILQKTEVSLRGNQQAHTVKWEWTLQAELELRNLNRTFTQAPILQHFFPAKPILVQTNVGAFTIVGILNQYDCFGVATLVNFYSWKCFSTKQNYDTYDQQILVIMETVKPGRH